MFYKLEIKEIIRETDEAVSLILEPSNGSAELFEFKAGQYLTFKYSINDREERRSYSICAAPHENVLKVMAKEVKGGLVSVHMNKNQPSRFLDSSLKLFHRCIGPHRHRWQSATRRRLAGRDRSLSGQRAAASHRRRRLHSGRLHRL